MPVILKKQIQTLPWHYTETETQISYSLVCFRTVVPFLKI